MSDRTSINHEDKWIAVSHVQKAIRRNEVAIAMAWTEKLWECDPAYVLFRMGVIAAVEVAAANASLAKAYLSTSIKKSWFDERTGLNSLLYFVEEFCRSAKDRTSCDLVSTPNLPCLNGAVTRTQKELDFNLLQEIAIDQQQTTPARVSALWLLAGTDKVPNPLLGIPRRGSLMHFLRASHAIAPNSDLISCIDMSLRLNKEPNLMALSICSQFYAPDKLASIKNNIDITPKLDYDLCAKTQLWHKRKLEKNRSNVMKRN